MHFLFSAGTGSDRGQGAGQADGGQLSENLVGESLTLRQVVLPFGPVVLALGKDCLVLWGRLSWPAWLRSFRPLRFANGVFAKILLLARAVLCLCDNRKTKPLDYSFDFMLFVAVAALIWAATYLLRHRRKGVTYRRR